MTFLHGSALTTAITAIVKDGKADLAVAFWGGEAVDRLGLPQDCSNIRIACDAYSGACNPKAFEDLLARNARIVDVPGLHAKVYNNHAAMVVTSANASTNGLTENTADIPGDEAGIHVTDSASVGDATAWFETIWQGRTAVTKDDVSDIRKLWNQRRNNRPVRSAKTLASLILEDSPELQERRLWVYIYRYEEVSMPHKLEYEKLTGQACEVITTSYGGSVYPFFTGKIERAEFGDEIICFEKKSRSIRFDGVWKIGAPLQGKYSITPCTEVERPLGLDIKPLSDWKKISKMVERLLKDGDLEIDSAPKPVGDFAGLIRKTAE